MAIFASKRFNQWQKGPKAKLKNSLRAIYSSKVRHLLVTHGARVELFGDRRCRVASAAVHRGRWTRRGARGWANPVRIRLHPLTGWAGTRAAPHTTASRSTSGDLCTKQMNEFNSNILKKKIIIISINCMQVCYRCQFQRKCKLFLSFE